MRGTPLLGCLHVCASARLKRVPPASSSTVWYVQPLLKPATTSMPGSYSRSCGYMKRSYNTTATIMSWLLALRCALDRFASQRHARNSLAELYSDNFIPSICVSVLACLAITHCCGFLKPAPTLDYICHLTLAAYVACTKYMLRVSQVYERNRALEAYRAIIEDGKSPNPPTTCQLISGLLRGARKQVDEYVPQAIEIWKDFKKREVSSLPGSGSLQALCLSLVRNCGHHYNVSSAASA